MHQVKYSIIFKLCKKNAVLRLIDLMLFFHRREEKNDKSKEIQLQSKQTNGKNHAHYKKSTTSLFFN
mgnify:CR=1 FL=1